MRILPAIVVLLIAGAAWAQEPAAPQGPVAYWKFDETAGTTAANEVAGGQNGTYAGGVTQSTTLPPALSYPNVRSLSFNGTNSVVSVPQFGTMTAMSVSVWINRATPPVATGRQTLVSYKEANGGGFVLSLNESGSTYYPRIFVHQGGWQNKEQAVTVPTGFWTHLVGTYDGATSSLRLYVNGLEAAPATAVGGNMTNPAGVTGLGARSSLNQHWYTGLIDDVRIYSRALTAAEVAVLHAGCPTPTALTATSGPGPQQISLAWTAPTGPAFTYTYNVKRGTVSGTYTTVATGVTGTTYVDTVPAAGPYFYVVTAVSAAESGPSNEDSEIPPPVSASPNTGLQTNENGTTTTFNLTFSQPAPAGGSLVTILSGDTTEGTVSESTFPYSAAGGGTGIQFTVPAGFAGAIPILVTGISDFLVDGNITYTISVTASGMGVTIPNVSVTNNDTNVPGITFSRVSGLGTNEGGGTDQFTVALNTQPFGFIDMALSSSNTLEATVSPASLRFTPSGNPTYSAATGVGDWNVAHVVTVTGVDDAVLDFTIPFTVVTGTLQLSNGSDNPAYAIDPPDVTGVNLDNEAIPTLPSVWGGGSGGGCGLLGPELLLPFALLRLRRRRRLNL